MREIDLHVHTNISDGSETPTETVKYACSLGLRAIAVTDHDSINGVAEAQRAGKECGLEVVAGMELGCGWDGRGGCTCSAMISISTRKSSHRCSTG